MPVSADDYKRLGRAFASAVSVIAARHPGKECIVALTVSSFVTLSFEPPLVMFAIQHKADSYPAMLNSKSFGVSILNVDQSDIGLRFASKGPDKIASTRFESGGVLQVPLVPHALAQIECLTHQVVMGGDHAIIVGMVEHVRVSAGQPLLYFARQFGAFEALIVKSTVNSQ